MTGNTMWTPGAHHGLIWPSGAALIDGDLSLETAIDLWRAMSAGGDLAVFLETLSAACGGLLAIPGFGVGINAEGGVHFAARGSFRVRTTDGENTDLDVSGAGAVTWSERLVPGVAAFLVSATNDDPCPESRPVVSGLVLAGSLMHGAIEEAAAGRAAHREATSPPRATDSDKTGVAGSFDGIDEDEEEDHYLQTAGADDHGMTRPPDDTDDRIEVNALAADGLSGQFDDLWGSTMIRSVEDAALRMVEEPDAGPAPLVVPVANPENPVPPVPRTASATVGGDHDGATLLRDVLDSEATRDVQEDQEDPAPGGEVLAAWCTTGHPNPPQRTSCRICEAQIAAQPPELIPQPSVGRVRASGGESADLRGTIIVGRNPRAAAGPASMVPKLLKISGFTHISGNHVELQVSRWTVIARDLGSLNGTFLRRRGEEPLRLTEPIPLYRGDVLDLGHGAVLTFEDLP